MHVGYAFDSGNFVQQEFLVVLHVRHHDFQLIVGRLSGDEQAFSHFRVRSDLLFKFFEAIRYAGPC